MTTTTTHSASPTADEITQALRAFGTGDGTHDAGRQARVLLETLPLPLLLPCLPPIWQSEETRRLKRRRWFLSSFLLPLLVGVASITLLCLGRNEPNGQYGYRFWCQIMQPIGFSLCSVLSIIRNRITDISPLQCGIARVCRLRLCWQFVPLLIEALEIDGSMASRQKIEWKAYRAETHALLTKLLPLWCEADTGPLSKQQRKILLHELNRVAFNGVVGYRKRGTPEMSLSEAEADFCLAALSTLRHDTAAHGTNLDERTRTTLSRLPVAIHTEDANRQHVQEAAQALLHVTL